MPIFVISIIVVKCNCPLHNTQNGMDVGVGMFIFDLPLIVISKNGSNDNQLASLLYRILGIRQQLRVPDTPLCEQ